MSPTMPTISYGSSLIPMMQSFAQRLFVGEHRVDELLADHYHFRAFTHFLLGEIPAAQQRNSHRSESSCD